MEEIFEGVVGIAVVVIALLLKSTKKNKQKTKVNSILQKAQTEEAVIAQETVKPAVFEQPHEHEGKKDVPCPAEEREKPRPVENKVSVQPAPVIPGLNLKFDRNSVLQGVVMSEILNRPRVGRRR